MYDILWYDMTKLTAEEIEKIFVKLNEHIKTPELEYSSPYTLLVAVILSAQATDKMVNIITSKLFEKANTPIKMIELGEDGLKSYIKSIGLYNAKARNIIGMSQMLVDHFNSEVPSNFQDLCSLPGVGSKSANVILNTIWKMPNIAVDRHVFRVSNRIGLCETTNIKDTETALAQVVPEEWRINAHNLLVLHGRYTCKAQSPLCKACCLNEACRYALSRDIIT